MTLRSVGSGLLLALCMSCSAGPGSGLAPLVPGQSLAGSLPGPVVLRSDETRGGLRKVTWAAGSARVEVRFTPVAEEAEAASLAADRARLLQSVFAQRHSPHKLAPGSQLRCPDHLRPRPLVLGPGSPRGQAHVLSANEQYVYGGCSSESTALASVYANLYCPQDQALYELRFFVAREQGSAGLERLVDSLRCLGP